MLNSTNCNYPTPFSYTNPNSRDSLDTSLSSCDQHPIHSALVNPLLLYLYDFRSVHYHLFLGCLQPSPTQSPCLNNVPFSLPSYCPLSMLTLARVILPKHKYDCVNLLLKTLQALPRGLSSPNLERSTRHVITHSSLPL